MTCAIISLIFVFLLSKPLTSSKFHTDLSVLVRAYVRCITYGFPCKLMYGTMMVPSRLEPVSDKRNISSKDFRFRSSLFGLQGPALRIPASLAHPPLGAYPHHLTNYGISPTFIFFVKIWNVPKVKLRVQYQCCKKFVRLIIDGHECFAPTQDGRTQGERGGIRRLFQGNTHLVAHGDIALRNREGESGPSPGTREHKCCSSKNIPSIVRFINIISISSFLRKFPEAIAHSPSSENLNVVCAADQTVMRLLISGMVRIQQ
ncbi:hypothetical protein BDZ94DRAFT_1235526 [Collybia nuda]|uniref:Uncharacterized protein n=1 Tax=Collybia nuda TaxID=64659 RepID=A0A9P5Y7W7_9AGAR|nr:hypothetical protein BDZ94DRAFT_1235526 [Collybia nuda]